MPSIAFKTLGCQLNYRDSGELADQVEKWGCRVVDGEADIIVVNTCTVTHKADRKSRQAIRSMKHRYPNAILMAIGCGVKVKEKGFAAIQELDQVFTDDADFLNYIKKIHIPPAGEGSDDRKKTQKPKKREGRTRAYIKIQDGCDHFCSYCIVPFARGRSRSREEKKILAEIRDMQERGYREFVITGVNIGDYKHKKSAGKSELSELLNKIFDQHPDIRIRLSSLCPAELTDELINIWINNRNICRHLHLSLQSASDSVLKRMKRPYSMKEVQETMKKMLKEMPNLAITADVIVGFPGETESEFEETLSFLKTSSFAKLHVFPFSAREGTVAAAMKSQLSPKIISKRAGEIREINNILNKKFVQKMHGAQRTVLWEKEDGGELIGLTDNYIEVRADKKNRHPNTFSDVILGKGNAIKLGGL